jgi:hypothetical protein
MTRKRSMDESMEVDHEDAEEEGDGMSRQPKVLEPSSENPFEVDNDVQKDGKDDSEVEVEDEGDDAAKKMDTDENTGNKEIKPDHSKEVEEKSYYETLARRALDHSQRDDDDDDDEVGNLAEYDPVNGFTNKRVKEDTEDINDITYPTTSTSFFDMGTHPHRIGEVTAASTFNPHQAFENSEWLTVTYSPTSPPYYKLSAIEKDLLRKGIEVFGFYGVGETGRRKRKRVVGSGTDGGFGEEHMQSSSHLWGGVRHGLRPMPMV